MIKGPVLTRFFFEARKISILQNVVCNVFLAVHHSPQQMTVPYLPICQSQNIKAAFVINIHYLVPRTDNAETNDKIAQTNFWCSSLAVVLCYEQSYTVTIRTCLGDISIQCGSNFFFQKRERFLNNEIRSTLYTLGIKRRHGLATGCSFMKQNGSRLQYKISSTRPAV